MKRVKENKVAIYAICKNELKFLDTFINNVYKEADYVIILDTGSTDGTWEKLQEYKENIPNLIIEQKIYEPWRFDTPRNDAMDMCPEDTTIYFSIDLDEIITSPNWGNILREKWEEKYNRAVYKYTWSHTDFGEEGRSFQYDKIHSKIWRWKYPVHECLYNIETKSTDYTREVELNLFNEIHLEHFPDKEKSRSSYLPLLIQRKKESLDNNESDISGLIYLAHEFSYNKLYDSSNEEFDNILNNYKDKLNSIELASCYLFRGDNSMYQSQLDEAKQFYLKSIEIDSTYLEPYLAIAKVSIEQKDYLNAIRYVKIGMKNSYRHYTWLERNYTWSYEPYDILAIALYYAGYKNESYVASMKALEFSPKDERLISNSRIILDNISFDEILSMNI